MKTVSIDPGICGLITKEEATANEDKDEVTLKVASGCAAVRAMMEELGAEFDAYEICLGKPGTGPLYEYAQAKFPGHCACPVLAGITKAVEVECGLALQKDSSITFVD